MELKERPASRMVSHSHGSCCWLMQGHKSLAASVPRTVPHHWLPIGIMLEKSTGSEIPGEPTHCNQTWPSLATQCHGSRGDAADLVQGEAKYRQVGGGLGWSMPTKDN